MVRWAQSNLSEDEYNGVNEVIKTGNYHAVRSVLNSVALRFQASRGTEGKMLEGRSPAADDIGLLDTQEKRAAAMSNPKWKTDPEWRARAYSRFV